MPLFHGRGADYYPKSSAVDVLLTAALKRAGYRGSRTKATYVTPLRKQALDYCRDQSEENLFEAFPRPGSILSWVTGERDLMLSLGTWMNRARWEGGAPRELDSLLNDIAGDIGILDVYLTRGMQRRKTALIADCFLRSLKVEEVAVGADGEFEHLYGEHVGEIWVTGECELRPALERDTQNSPMP